jgi:pilus assembly protein CpaB
MAIKVNKTWVVLGVAVVIGLAAALGARQYLAKRLSEGRGEAPRGASVNVVVAVEDLPKGAVLTLKNVASRSVPNEFAHSAAVRPNQFERVTGRKLNTPLRAGESLLWNLIDDPNAVALAARVSDGRRALSVPVDEINSLSGMLQPGDRVDLYVSLTRDTRKIVLPVLQNLGVLAAGNRVVVEQPSGDKRTFTTITLEASPEEARVVVLARDVGRLTAMLRNPNDTRSIDIPGNVSALLGGGPLQVDVPRRVIPVLVGGRPLPQMNSLGDTQEVAALARLAEAVERLAPGAAGTTPPSPAPSATPARVTPVSPLAPVSAPGNAAFLTK